MRSDEEVIQELIERAIELVRRREVWWQFVNTFNRQRDESVISDHEDFFLTVSLALFESFSVITYQLYETRNDTISIPYVIKLLEGEDSVRAQQLSTLVSQKRALLAKVFPIRCDIYAHRNQERSPEETFSVAGLSPEDMADIVDTTTELVATLAEIAGVEEKQSVVHEIEHRGDMAREDTKRLMETLRQDGRPPAVKPDLDR